MGTYGLDVSNSVSLKAVKKLNQHPCFLILEMMFQLRKAQRLKAENQHLQLEIQCLQAENHQLQSETQHLQAKNQAAMNKEVTYRKEQVHQEQNRLDRLMCKA